MEWTFSDSVRLSLLSFSEASKACAALPGFSLFRRSLQPERIEYCRAELLPDCLVGSLAVPDKTHPLHLAFSLAFYLDRGQLILAADEQTLPALQSLLFPEEPLDTSDVFHLFFSFLESLIQEDMLAELDYGAIPNFQLMDPQFTHLSFDPENKYTVPYTWGSVGIIYNTTMVDEPITSWGAMFDEKYAGQVLMINNSRDALMAALCYLGYDINTTDEGQLTEAFELVKNAKDKGVYQAFVMDEVFGKMEGGNAAITMYYAGDYLTMLENNEDLAFVIPEEGSNWFVDAMCVLKSSQHKAEAYEWINFIASTDSNLANMDYIWYASPNAEALAEYPAYYEEQYGEPLDEEIYNIMAIPDEERERCEIYVNLPQETLKFYDKLWTQLGV